MKRKSIALLLLLTAAAGLAWFLVNGHRAEDRPQAANTRPESRVATVNGVTAVALSPALQLQSDLRTETLQASKYRPQTSAYGIVVDIQPLLDLHARYGIAAGQLAVARAAESASKGEYQRLRLLNQADQNVSDKDTQAAEARWISDQAQVRAALTALANLKSLARAQWGERLSVLVTAAAPGPFSALLDGRERLLQVTLPLNVEPSSPPPTVLVHNGGVGRVLSARLVSASPQSDPRVQGTTFFYRLPARTTRIGMRLPVDFPLPGALRQGVVIPLAAVLWYGNQSWVYLQIDPEHFIRRAVATNTPAPGGYFETGLQPGQKVVVTGAQLLLSQELQPQLGTGAQAGGDEGDDD